MAVTIKDVAREAGTSIGTVSKALNDSYTISDETKKHVREIAKKLNYLPNVRAQTLARKTGRQAAFLTQLSRDIGFTNPHMFEILAGAEAAFADKGYALNLRGCGAKDVCGVAKDIIQSKSADGLLIHASVVTHELAAMIIREELPHIVIGMPSFSSRLCWIDSNNHLAGEIAAHHLLEKGHRQIAFIGGQEDDKISEARLKGVLSELKNGNSPYQDTAIYKGASTAQCGYNLTVKLLNNRHNISAIICANNYLAFGCMNALSDKGVSVPKDISLITFDSYPFAEILNPKLTTVSIDVFEMGIQAAKLLITKIKKPNMQVQSFATLPNLIVRGST